MEIKKGKEMILAFFIEQNFGFYVIVLSETKQE
jgi:hypothetical protein